MSCAFLQRRARHASQGVRVPRRAVAVRRPDLTLDEIVTAMRKRRIRVQPGRRKSTSGRSRNRSEARKILDAISAPLGNGCRLRSPKPIGRSIENSTEKTAKERDMGKLEGKIALITGGNGGIGLGRRSGL